MPRGDPKDEYKDLSDNMRNYVNVRFAQLTLFVAITAALVTIAFTSEPPVSDSMRFVLKIGGIITTVVFAIMEERAADYWHHYRRRAVELERELGYKQYSTRPARRIMSATNAVRVFYICVFLFWLATLIWYSNF